MKDNKIFIPLTLDDSTKTFFSGKQLIGFCVFSVIYLVFQIFAVRLHNEVFFGNWWSGLAMAGTEIAGTYFIVYLLRKIVIREDKILQNYRDNEALQKTELDFAWDIFSIKNSRIRYCSSGREAVVVRLTHGYLLDRPADQEQVHRQAINTAISNLSKQGYSHIYLNREVRDANLAPLQETQRHMTKYRGTALYDLGNQIIRHTSAVCANVANTEQEYYVILADSITTIKNLDIAAKEFINALQDSVYVRMDILSDSEIWEFICSLYGLKFIDKSRLLNRMFSSNGMDFIDILEINRASQNLPNNATNAQPYKDSKDVIVDTTVSTVAGSTTADSSAETNEFSEEDYL